MKPSVDIDLFKISKDLLQFVGETYERTPKRIVLFRIFNSAMMVYISIFIVANFLYVTGGNYVETMQGLISVTHVRGYIHGMIQRLLGCDSFQVFLKYLFYMYFKSGIMELLESEFETFWNFKHSDSYILNNTINVYKATEFVQSLVIVTAAVLFYLYLFRPILAENPFPFEAWVSGVTIVDVVALACQYYFFCIIVPIVVGYDGIYLCSCIQTVEHVKLLKNRILNFPENVQEDAHYYIKCHQILLRYGVHLYIYIYIFYIYFLIAILLGEAI